MSMAAVTICSDFGAPQNKVCHRFHCFPIYLPWSDGTTYDDRSFLNAEFKASFFNLSFTFIKRLFSFSFKEQAPFNFMAAVTICSDFGAPQNKVGHRFPCFLIYLPWSDGTGCHDVSFLMLSFKPAFSLSSFTFIKRLFSSSSLSAIRVVSSVYLRLLIYSRPSWLQLMIHPAWISHDVLCIRVK